VPDKKIAKKDPTGFYKPYRIKPAEIYVKPNPNVCAKNKKDEE